MTKQEMNKEHEVLVNGLKCDIAQLEDIGEMELAEELKVIISHNYVFSSDTNPVIKSKIKKLNEAMKKSSSKLVKW